jgi:hypothetical protein
MSLTRRARRAARDERGTAIIIAMAFMFIFLLMGLALVLLLQSARSGTELERADVKAFNVAEAGVDAGMLALKLGWPDTALSPTSVDDSLLKTALQSANPRLYDPSRSSASEFLDVVLYDNVDEDGDTTMIPYSQAPDWDSNEDGMMFVDSRSNVDDNRRRIIILAQRQHWPFEFPGNRAMWATSAGANGQGLKVYVDPLSPVQTATAYWDTDFGKGVEMGSGVARDTQTATWDQVVSPQTWLSLERIAQGNGTYFTSATAASAFLAQGNSGGSVVFVKANSAVTVVGNTQMGTRDNPLILVLDTPEGSNNTIDLRGTSDFYGIIIVKGNAMIRGTASIWGQMLASGTIEGKGTGSVPEINYNSQVLDNLNRTYIISVNIVPNTWEEYTVSPDQY